MTDVSTATRALAAIANSSIFRFDQWASVAAAPTDVAFELKPRGLVFRGINNFESACHYARQVQEFFADNGYLGAVYVVRGPTSTAREAFEVVDAPYGYAIAYRVLPAVEAANEQQSDTAPERQRQRG